MWSFNLELTNSDYYVGLGGISEWILKSMCTFVCRAGVSLRTKPFNHVSFWPILQILCIPIKQNQDESFSWVRALSKFRDNSKSEVHILFTRHGGKGTPKSHGGTGAPKHKWLSPLTTNIVARPQHHNAWYQNNRNVTQSHLHFNNQILGIQNVVRFYFLSKAISKLPTFCC